MKFLVVDDDPAISEMIGIILKSEGYEAEFCDTGNGVIEKFRETEPDIVLLDVMLPGKSGVEIAGEIRNESTVPIVMLTAKTDTADVVAGLEAGADDYISKPFKPAELIARIKARLRNTVSDGDTQTIPVKDLVIDTNRHSVSRGGESILLTPLEYDLLYTMAKEPWQAFTREELLERVWGYPNATDTRLVNVHVQRLRAKIEHDLDNPEIITTVRGVGYKAGEGQP